MHDEDKKKGLDPNDDVHEEEKEKVNTPNPTLEGKEDKTPKEDKEDKKEPEKEKELAKEPEKEKAPAPQKEDDDSQKAIDKAVSVALEKALEPVRQEITALKAQIEAMKRGAPEKAEKKEVNELDRLTKKYNA